QDGDPGVVEHERPPHQLRVLDRPAAVRLLPPDQLRGPEVVERGLHGALVVPHDGPPVGGLVARGDESVEAQRVLIGRGTRRLDETPEHARGRCGESHPATVEQAGLAGTLAGVTDTAETPRYLG